jgi:hypothetical protein
VPRYRVYRIKDSQKEHFRWSAHTGGLAIVKPKDYEQGGEVESPTPYALWKELQDTGSPHLERPLSPGDILETIESEGPSRLFITKYIGFEPAQWFIPEVRGADQAATSPDDSALAPQREKALQS